MERTPPANVRRRLREEVGFSCPVEKRGERCGSPYLGYHHFDPPWRIKHHHNPDGMIALCLQHHKEADVGTFTIEQLRELKKTAAKREPISGRFNWRRENALIIAGSNFFIGSPTILESEQQKFIWFEKDESNYDTVNMDLFSSAGNLVFQMRNNDWLAHPSFDDIEAPPSARWLKIRSKTHDVSFDLVFSNQDLDGIAKVARTIRQDSIRKSVEQYNEFHKNAGLASIIPKKNFEEELNSAIEKVLKYVSDNLGEKDVLTCQVKLKITYPVSLKLSPTKLTTQIMKSRFTMSGCLLGSATVIKI